MKTRFIAIALAVLTALTMFVGNASAALPPVAPPAEAIGWPEDVTRPVVVDEPATIEYTFDLDAHLEDTDQPADFMPLDETEMLMQAQLNVTTQLDIDASAFLDAVFQYANIIIEALLVIAGIRAGIAFGFRILNQISSIFGG